MAEENIKELALKFAEKNPSLLREMMESYFVRFKVLEFSQGRMTKGEVEEKHYKEVK
jgi:hypothetical protein